MAQDNVLKKPTQMPVVENGAGNETGVSPQGEWGTTAGEHAAFKNPSGEINISASTENRSAQFKNPQKKQDGGEFSEPIPKY